ncbi:unnamed protein product [Dibothriocephalus latus]|uniref:Uncharacterized protein n=1 Tax=Dibothriocephalus latus TaxID=60516 RepID=A0A3P7MAI1_DIBLA|nr:unnamed protein product [Dibothriocephalus latus]
MESTAIKLLTSDARISPESLAEFSSDLNLLMCLDAPPTYGSPVLPSLPQTDQFRQFAYCQLQFASFLSNLSVLPESVPLLSQDAVYQDQSELRKGDFQQRSKFHPERVRRWLKLWSMSQDIRLQLLVVKLQSNLGVHVSRQNKKVTEVPSSEKPEFYLPETCNPSLPSVGTDEPAIFGPDIFKLDLRE